MLQRNTNKRQTALLLHFVLKRGRHMKRRFEYRIVRYILPILLCMISVSVCTWGIIRLSVHEDYCIHGLMDKHLEVAAVNAPKDTYHLEILVPKAVLNRNRHYVDWNLDKMEMSDGIDMLRRLSQYEQDGYVSATLHYDYSCHITYKARRDGDWLIDYFWIEFPKSCQWDFERIRDYKIAYVDKNGNVLGVTDQAAVQTTLDSLAGFRLTADGSTASCVAYNPTAHIALTGLKVFAVHALLILLVWYLRRSSRKNKMPQSVPADQADT